MPKTKAPMDEDRARRRELLEQKRAARRAAKEDQQQQEQKEQEDAAKKQPIGASGDNQTVESSPGNNNEVNKKGNDSCPIIHLPEDPIRVIYSMLTAADLGRTISTCQYLNHMLVTARASYFLSRLNPNHHRHDDFTITQQQQQQQQQNGIIRSLQLCPTLQQAHDLVHDSLMAGGDTGRSISNVNRKKKNKEWLTSLAESNQFPGYARFLEECLPRAPIGNSGSCCSCSPEHSLCRVGGDGTTSGPFSGVASWGVGKRGQLGHSGKDARNDEAYPKRLLYGIGYGVRIVQVAAGGGLVRVAHSLLLTSTGRVLSFGTGQYGALGHGYNAAKQLPDVTQPKYIEALFHETVAQISAGELHSGAVTDNGDVYTWGDGFCGQLGHGDKRPRVLPKQIVTGDLQDECVATMSCGSRHTLVVTEDGECFSFGLGHFGVLGRSFTPFEYDVDAAVVGTMGHDADDNTEARLAAVQQMAADPEPPARQQQSQQQQERDAAAELAAHLDLIANLSLDDASDQCIPKVLDSLQGIKIVGASAGHRHSLLLDIHGALYSCGAGSSGCLGHGDTSSQMYPCRIRAFDEEKDARIIQMSAGVDMSMAVSNYGRVYGWGKTDSGRLGLGNAKGHVTLPRRVYLTEERYNDESPSAKAVDVECGYVHSLIVCLNGTIYQCGNVGVNGQQDGAQHLEGHDGKEQESDGRPRILNDLNVWHRTPEPKAEIVKKERWKKYGKYEVKGRSKMLDGED